MPLSLKFYIYTVIFLGLATLIFFVPQVKLNVIPIIFVIGIIAGLFEKYSVELPNGTIFTGGATLPLVTMIYYGIPEAITVVILSIIVCFLLVSDKSQIIKDFFNVSQYTICILFSGIVYSLLGGTIGTFSLGDIPKLLIAIAIYNLINLSILSVVISTLKQKKYLSTWIEAVQDGIFIYVVTALISIRLAFIMNLQDMLQFWIEVVFIFILFLALRYAFSLFINLRKTYLTSMESLTHMTESKLSISKGHSTRVGRVARQIAEHLKLSQSEIDAIHYASLLHDVGKIHLKEQMFKKRGPLTIEEEKEYRNHVNMGADMVKEIAGLENAAEYIRYHHEQWNGLGFPQGKKGEEIPLGARIIAVANEYDHIINDHRIKKPSTEFKKIAHYKLDPQLVEIAMDIVDFSSDSKHSVHEAAIEEKLIETIVLSTTRNKFYESKLLEKFGSSLIVTYDNMFRDEEGKGITIPCESEVLDLVKKAKSKQHRIRDFIEEAETGKVYDIYCVPFDQQVKIMFFDVSHLLDYEKKQEERVRLLYRDVIYSVTQGKLLLADNQEIKSFYQTTLVEEALIKTKLDVAQCREKVKKVLEDVDIPEKMKFNLLLCTSEAVTNVLKHATEGLMKVYQHEKSLRIIVEDDGSGMELSDIPKSTLLSGYSSKISMGQGYSLLLKLMDQVIISTGKTGTTIVLEMKIVSEKEVRS
jgi:HD-GYP domain-containing protein (c-di-GMP phosphodiesterase class II)/anti-sigma regulatory factor (Ser/Thr protein kinase)